MWGVGAEPKVVVTGLVGNQSSSTGGYKGKAVEGKGRIWRGEAIRALTMVFEVSYAGSLCQVTARKMEKRQLMTA